MLAMIGAASLIVLILGGGVVYEYVIKPNAVLAEVNGHEIRREDYWKYQSITLYNQARQYESFAAQTTGPQQQQFLQFAATFDAQREDIWGSTEVSDATLQQMIEDRLYLDGAEEMGITVSEEEADLFALNAFAGQDAPLVTPLPSPTLIPERAEAATETAAAVATEQSIALGTPVTTPQATPIAGTPPGGTLVGTVPAATPVSDTAETPVATPDPVTARDNAESQFSLFQREVFDEANLSMEEFQELYIVPQVVRTRVNHEVTSAVPQRADQVRAQHILVGTEELARQLYEQATGGADFGQLARTNSTDTATAATGGQLGWFTRQEVPPALAEAAFSLQAGEISQPVQTEFGWHLVRVMERQEDRPLTPAQYQLATDKAIEAWIAEQRAEASISTEAEIEPTPTPAQFAPPAGVPTPEMPSPEATPIVPEAATPIASAGQGTPETGAVASPEIVPPGTPGGIPVATPAG